MTQHFDSAIPKVNNNESLSEYYGDIIYDQPQNESFIEKLESVKYNTALKVAGTIQGSSCYMIYHELGLKSFKSNYINVSVACLK